MTNLTPFIGVEGNVGDNRSFLSELRRHAKHCRRSFVEFQFKYFYNSNALHKMHFYTYHTWVGPYHLALW